MWLVGSITCLLLFGSPVFGGAISTISDGQPPAPAKTPPPSACVPPTPVSVRLPPSLVGDTSPPGWQPPPTPWLYGNWKITYSSQPAYQFLPNFQSDHYPVLPQAPPDVYRQVDLTSWSLFNSTSTTVITAFGYIDPLFAIDPTGFTYNFTGTGFAAALTNIWELMAWGYDTNGDGYFVIYETPPEPGLPPDVTISSRVETGPTAATVKAILKKMAALGNAEISGFAAGMLKIPVDGRRTGLPPVVCDASCVQNVDLVPAS